MRTLVKTKTLLDCTGSAPIEQGCFVFENGIIEAVGTLGELSSMEGIENTIDLSDRFVMPGLIDAHIHLGLSHLDRIEPMSVTAQMSQPPQTKICKAVMYLRQHLDGGVTTVRAMGEEHYIDIEMARAVDEGYIQGPRIITAGNIITATHGQGQVGLTISDGVEGVRKTCRQNLAKGADFLKIFVSGGVVSGKGGLQISTYNVDEIRTAVEEAQALNTYVAAHVHGGPGLDFCIDCGVRSLEHASMPTDKQIEKIIKHGVWVTGTFSPAFHPMGIHILNKEQTKRLELAKSFFLDSFRKFVKFGAKMSFGTDGVHGEIAFEAIMLAEHCGASNMQAIGYITREAARACRREDSIGTLEVGKFADFIALEKNPLEDLHNLQTVTGTYISGEKK